MKYLFPYYYMKIDPVFIEKMNMLHHLFITVKKIILHLYSSNDITTKNVENSV